MACLLIPGKGPKRFYVFGTASDSGKSVISDFLSTVLGETNVSLKPLHQFGGRHDMADIAGKMLNISLDMAEAPLSQEIIGAIKEITGDIRNNAEPKYKSSKAIRNICKLAVNTNSPIRLSSPDRAFWNRVTIVPMMISVPEEKQDMELQQKLLDERDGIVSKLVRLLGRLTECNYDLSKCSLAEQMKTEWMSGERDLVCDFLDEYCVITNNQEDFIKSSELYRIYEQFAKENYEIPQKNNVFTRRVRQKINSICNTGSNMIRFPGEEIPSRIVRGIKWIGA